jgi:hypothetical protein
MYGLGTGFLSIIGSARSCTTAGNFSVGFVGCGSGTVSSVSVALGGVMYWSGIGSSLCSVNNCLCFVVRWKMQILHAIESGLTLGGGSLVVKC